MVLHRYVCDRHQRQEQEQEARRGGSQCTQGWGLVLCLYRQFQESCIPATSKFNKLLAAALLSR